MEKVRILISNPFEMEYGLQSETLTLTGVESLPGGRQYEIRFDPEATRALVELLGQAMKQHGKMLGREPGAGQKVQ